jgi:uncharacterized protein
MEFNWHDEVPPETAFGRGSVVLSAFPSAGLATTVAAHYILKVLDLPRIARFESPELPPIAVVSGGVVNPTIRAYGRPGLAVVLSEFPPTPSQANAIASTILDAAERHQARMVICLEGVVPHPEDGDTDPPGAEAPPDEQVWVAFAKQDPELAKTFAAARTRALEEGVIGGVSGAMLIRGMGRPVPIAVLLVSARVAEGLPDHRAGAALIEALDRLLPELKIDTRPLRAQAEQIEKALRAVMKSHSTASAAPAPPSEAPASPEMYR